VTVSMHSIRQRTAAFLFPVESDRWLSVLRIGLGLQVVLYTLSSRADWNELFTRTGWGLVNRELTEAVLNVQSVFAPRLGWLVRIGDRFGFDDAIVLWAAWGCLLFAGCCLIAGFFCRASAITAWFLHLCAVNSEELLSYGMDNFTTIGLFYLMLSPLPDRFSLDWGLRNRKPRCPRFLGFFRRVLQIHLCVVYFFSGATKAIAAEWWNGTSVWQALISPEFNLISPEVLVSYKYLLPLVGSTICLLETGYPLFIWSKKTRTIWLTCIIGMHIAVVLTMGLFLFSLIMITLNIAAFGSVRIFGQRALEAGYSDIRAN
jgi:hypothetical protein